MEEDRRRNRQLWKPKEDRWTAGGERKTRESGQPDFMQSLPFIQISVIFWRNIALKNKNALWHVTYSK